MTIAIPVVTIAFFLLIMLSTTFLKKPLGKDDNVPMAIEMLMNDVRKEKWEEANKKTDQLNNAWQKVVKRVQFSAERDEINSFTMNVARLRGAIMAKDKASALVELREAYEHWKEIGK